MLVFMFIGEAARVHPVTMELASLGKGEEPQLIEEEAETLVKMVDQASSYWRIQ